MATVLGNQFFPLTKNGEIPKDLQVYEYGQDILMDCISRDIDKNGEHKFDSQDRIIHVPFPICKETGQPLTFKYGVSENKNCTINFSDELYHLFQLYIHEDAPFSCRIPLSTEPHYLEKGGAYVPLTFNFRGELHDSHLDIDPVLNVIFTKPSTNDPSQNVIISSIAYSSSTNVTRIVIGNDLTLNLAVRWFDSLTVTNSNNNPAGQLPFQDGSYVLPLYSIPISYTHLIMYIIMTVVIASVITIAFTYNIIRRKFVKHRHQLLDNETGVSKRD